MISCHALLLPSLAECFGCVYCEANAYGLPVIGRNTGGVSEIIKEGVNGLMLNKEEFPSDLAIKFLSLIQDIEQYKNISINARNEYERHLNYETFVLGIENIIKKNNL
jgi:glycosyltransferase involved in cell wall biosynthesis